jgi:hypothetical protein
VIVSNDQADALARLDVFIGQWSMEARFPGGTGTPVGRSRFEWALGGQFLVQHTEVPIPEAPDSLAIVGVDVQSGGYVQHYYDSRGVARLYAMSFADGVWTLLRESPDFSALDFGQRFTATLSADGTTITGAWQKCFDGSEWEHDFALNYRRIG